MRRSQLTAGVIACSGRQVSAASVTRLKVLVYLSYRCLNCVNPHAIRSLSGSMCPCEPLHLYLHLLGDIHALVTKVPPIDVLGRVRVPPPYFFFAGLGGWWRGWRCRTPGLAHCVQGCFLLRVEFFW